MCLFFCMNISSYRTVTYCQYLSNRQINKQTDRQTNKQIDQASNQQTCFESNDEKQLLYSVGTVVCSLLFASTIRQRRYQSICTSEYVRTKETTQESDNDTEREREREREHSRRSLRLMQILHTKLFVSRCSK
jgi:hypothetical protein